MHSKKEKSLLLYSIFESIEDNFIFNPDANIQKETLIDEYVKVTVSMLVG